VPAWVLGQQEGKPSPSAQPRLIGLSDLALVISPPLPGGARSSCRRLLLLAATTDQRGFVTVSVDRGEPTILGSLLRS